MIDPKLQTLCDKLNACQVFGVKLYKSVDSGTGENFYNGMEGALPYPHIFLQVHPNDLVHMTRYTLQALKKWNINTSQLQVQGTFDAVDEIGIIAIMDPFHTGELYV